MSQNQLDLKIWPDTFLKTKAELVTEFDKELQNLAEAMMKVVQEAKGLGLAAPQIGVSKQVIAYNINGEQGFLVNPTILETSKETQKIQEGCLSFPGVFVTVERYKEVKIRFYDLNGVEKEMEAKGLHAQLVQHELDHLNGLVFTRFLSSLKRDVVNRKMKKLKKFLDNRWQYYDKLKQEAERTEEHRPQIGTPVVAGPTGRDTGLYDFSVSEE